MLVPECSGLFIGFLWRKSILNMPPHSQDGVFMQHVGEKCLCHTATTEKKPEPKKQPQTQTIFWRRKNHHTHTKDKRVFDGTNALSTHLLAESTCNQLQPNPDADTKTDPLPNPWVVVEKRGVCGNN